MVPPGPGDERRRRGIEITDDNLGRAAQGTGVAEPPIRADYQRGPRRKIVQRRGCPQPPVGNDESRSAHAGCTGLTRCIDRRTIGVRMRLTATSIAM